MFYWNILTLVQDIDLPLTQNDSPIQGTTCLQLSSPVSSSKVNWIPPISTQPKAISCTSLSEEYLIVFWSDLESRYYYLWICNDSRLAAYWWAFPADWLCFDLSLRKDWVALLTCEQLCLRLHSNVKEIFAPYGVCDPRRQWGLGFVPALWIRIPHILATDQGAAWSVD